MTTELSSILDQDYSEAMIRIQQLHKQLQRELRDSNFVAARNTARKVAAVDRPQKPLKNLRGLLQLCSSSLAFWHGGGTNNGN